MNPWLETTGVVLIALFGVFAGGPARGFAGQWYWDMFCLRCGAVLRRQIQ
jgi:hypothetical protein